MNFRGTLISIEPWTQYFDLKGQAPPAQRVENVTISNISGNLSGFGAIAGAAKSVISDITLENIDIRLTNPQVTVKNVTGLKVDNVKINGAAYVPDKAATP